MFISCEYPNKKKTFKKDLGKTLKNKCFFSSIITLFILIFTKKSIMKNAASFVTEIKFETECFYSAVLRFYE